jgi:outer membrane protein assembly factor BamB
MAKIDKRLPTINEYMDKRFVGLLSFCLVAIIVSAVAINGKIGLPASIVKTSDPLWQTHVNHFSDGFTVADGKVFRTDAWNGLFCYDARDGHLLWTYDTHGGGYGGGMVEVYDGKVFVGIPAMEVDQLNEDTGNLEVKYTVPYCLLISAYRAIPYFYIADGKLFAGYQSLRVAYDLASGEKLWERPDIGDYQAFDAGKTMPKSDYAIITDDPYGDKVRRLDANTGNELWNYSGWWQGDALISDKKAIISNLSPIEPNDVTNEKYIVCLDVDTGKLIWNYSLGASGTSAYQPIISENALLFGATDGCLYSFDIATGTLNWQVKVDLKGILETQDTTYSKTAEGNEPYVDLRNQRLYYSLISAKSNGDNTSYSGTIMSLDLRTGGVLWSTRFSFIGGGFAFSGSFVSLNNQLFIAEGTGLFCLEKDTGTIQWQRVFDHCISGPLIVDNTLYLTADLYAIAY